MPKISEVSKMRAILILLLLVATSVVTLAPTAAATCTVGDTACVCGYNDSCGYDSCAFAFVLSDQWEHDEVPGNGGFGVGCSGDFWQCYDAFVQVCPRGPLPTDIGPVDP